MRTRHLTRVARLTWPLLLSALTGCTEPEPPLALEVWYGGSQRVGHLGAGQHDFNLLGETTSSRLDASLNGGPPKRLSVSHERFGFRRLGGPGHFNLDLPLTALQEGANEVVLTARHGNGTTLERRVILERLHGSTPLPLAIDWGALKSPQDAGWCVDGLWELEGDQLRSRYPAYDRVYAIGDETWRDYEVRATFVVHAVADETGPYSGGNGFGVVFRFQGHCVGGPLDFPAAQPKWGYLPFGAITWLRWKKGAPQEDPRLQFYRGDRNELDDHGPRPIALERVYSLVASCVTLDDGPTGEGRTKYELRVWPAEEAEPTAPGLEVLQVSRDALRSGGFAFVAHHVDVSIGAVRVDPLD